MLELNYLDNQKLVDISMSGDISSWPEIRSVFIESAREIHLITENSVQVPVWVFLSCRKELAYTIEKHNIEFSVDDELRTVLSNSLKNESEYRNPQDQVAEAQLLHKLSSEGFIRSLTPEQLRNILYLCKLQSGATFSVPGAGKTTEALAFYCYKKRPNDKLLVVCPKNAFIAWEEQTSVCFSEPPRVIRLIGGEEKIKKLLIENGCIFIISYQQFSMLGDQISEFLYTKPCFMFLDESHRIKKGIEGQWCNSILAVSHLPVHKLIMSGTPLPNSLSDVIPQFNFLFPEIEVNEDNVKQKISSIYVRTTKQELGLPKLTRSLVEIEMKPEQRRFYDLLRSEEAKKCSNINLADRRTLRRIGRSVMRLLQLASNPALLAGVESSLTPGVSSIFSEGDGPKIEYACLRARKLALQGRKTIIWSNFVANVEIIANRLKDLGAEFIHGGVEAGSDEELFTREYKLKKFHTDENTFVLVANPAACAEGISLHTVCHDAIYIDRTYNVAQYLQSEDRIHRLGLPEKTITHVELLVSPNSIDESINRRLIAKVERMAKVLNDKSLNIEPTDPDDEDIGLDNIDIIDFLNHLQKA